MREMERKQGHDSTGAEEAHRGGTFSLGFGAVLGLGVGKRRGVLQKKATSRQCLGIARYQQRPGRRGVLSREKSVQGLVRTQRLLFRVPRIGAGSLWLDWGVSWVE